MIRIVLVELLARTLRAHADDQARKNADDVAELPVLVAALGAMTRWRQALEANYGQVWRERHLAARGRELRARELSPEDRREIAMESAHLAVRNVLEALYVEQHRHSLAHGAGIPMILIQECLASILGNCAREQREATIGPDAREAWDDLVAEVCRSFKIHRVPPPTGGAAS